MRVLDLRSASQPTEPELVNRRIVVALLTLAASPALAQDAEEPDTEADAERDTEAGTDTATEPEPAPAALPPEGDVVGRERSSKRTGNHLTELLDFSGHGPYSPVTKH